MFDIIISLFIFVKLKKEIFGLKEELDEARKKISEFEKLKNAYFETGSMYVVNVCALFITSDREILLTGNEYSLLKEIKGLKYRPIVITGVKIPEVQFIALSTYPPYQKNKDIQIFRTDNCKFYTENCFIGNIKKECRIFGVTVKRARGNKSKKLIKGKVFSMPIQVFRDLEHLEASKYKEDVIEKCRIYPKNPKTGIIDYESNRMSENYKLIKKCAICDKEYMKKILNQIEG